MSRRLSLSHRYRLLLNKQPQQRPVFDFRRPEELTRFTNNSVFSRIVPKEQRALLISVRVLQHRSLKGNRRFKIMFYFYRERHCLWVVFFWKEMRFSQYIFCKYCVFRCSMDADSLTINNINTMRLHLISNIHPCQISLGKSKKSVFVRENDSLCSFRNATLVRDLVVKIPLM